jgi:hypothetical protein
MTQLMESFYTPQEVADALKLDANTIRRIFCDMPGVLKLTTARLRGKRPYVTLRIPGSILSRVIAERSK